MHRLDFDILKKWQDSVGGFTHPDEALLLSELAVDKDVLELGAWKGFTTIAMGVNAYHVTTIDTFKGDIHTGDADTLDEFLNNLNRFEITDKVTVMIDDTIEGMMDLHSQGRFFDLIFIDATHTYDASYDDSMLAYELLKPGGLMAWHDYRPDCEVMKAVDNFTGLYGMTKKHHLINLVVYEKK